MTGAAGSTANERDERDWSRGVHVSLTSRGPNAIGLLIGRGLRSGPFDPTDGSRKTTRMVDHAEEIRVGAHPDGKILHTVAVDLTGPPASVDGEIDALATWIEGRSKQPRSTTA